MSKLMIWAIVTVGAFVLGMSLTDIVWGSIMVIMHHALVYWLQRYMVNAWQRGVLEYGSLGLVMLWALCIIGQQWYLLLLSVLVFGVIILYTVTENAKELG